MSSRKQTQSAQAVGLLVAALLVSAVFVDGASAGPPSDPQILNAHEQQVDHPGMPVFTNVEEVVPITEIISRCGDGDGCRLRLFMGGANMGGGPGLATRLAAQLFSVDSTGAEWTIHDPKDPPVLGDRTSQGDSTDAIKGSIIFFNTGSEICEFYESGTTNDYRLTSQPTSLSPPFDCRLRIDD